MRGGGGGGRKKLHMGGGGSALGRTIEVCVGGGAGENITEI